MLRSPTRTPEALVHRLAALDRRLSRILRRSGDVGALASLGAAAAALVRWGLPW